MGSQITIKAGDGGAFSAYIAKPASGTGPGLVLLQEIFGVNQYLRDKADLFAEEGYVTIVPDLFWRMEPGVELGYNEADFQKAFGFYGKFDVDQGIRDIKSSIDHLRNMDECQGRDGQSHVAAMGFCLGGKLAYLTAARTDVDAAVGYYGVGIEGALDEASSITCPMVLHIAGNDNFCPPEAQAQLAQALGAMANVRLFTYPGCDHAFDTSGREHHDPQASKLAHSRTLECFKPAVGPVFDLEALWDRHCELEFATRDAKETMKTMVAEPYVNHIPTMTGGVGYKDLYRFYNHHFIPQTPKDTSLVPISRTVGADRLVDEMLFCFTHDIEIDWMLPGIPPTGKKVEIPLLAVVHFRGDKLYNEHIYWDQASVLVQIGLLDPQGLPVAGRETANKLKDPREPSNTLMANWSKSEGLS